MLNVFVVDVYEIWGVKSDASDRLCASSAPIPGGRPPVPGDELEFDVTHRFISTITWIQQEATFGARGRKPSRKQRRPGFERKAGPFCSVASTARESQVSPVHCEPPIAISGKTGAAVSFVAWPKVVDVFTLLSDEALAITTTPTLGLRKRRAHVVAAMSIQSYWRSRTNRVT